MLISTIHKLLLVTSIALTMFGCSPEKEAKVVEKPNSDLPIIKVDEEHTQVRSPDSRSKHLVYELIGPVTKIYLDTTSFNFSAYNLPKPNETSQKAIQVMHAPTASERENFLKDMKVYTMPFVEKNKMQEIKLVNPIGANNILVIAIGWESTIKGKIDMKPVWLGSIRVK